MLVKIYFNFVKYRIMARWQGNYNQTHDKKCLYYILILNVIRKIF
jgi:hypothetical protein